MKASTLLKSAALTALLAAPVAAQTPLSIATGGTGGVYYPMGGGLAEVINAHVEGYAATAEVTGASVENMGLIATGDADLALALCRDIQGVLNEDLRLLVMSATLDVERVAHVLGRAPVLTCPGQAHPVETIYCGRPGGQTVEGAVVATVRKAVAEGRGSMLVFLPGAAEIRRVAKQLEASSLGPAWRIAPLYGNLSLASQASAILPAATLYELWGLIGTAETALMVVLITVAVPHSLSRPPPKPSLALLPLTVQSISVSVPISAQSAAARGALTNTSR